MEDDYLIDSDILIDHMRRPDLAADFLRSAFEKRRRVSISVATLVELYSAKSVLRLDGRLVVDNFVAIFRIVPLDSQIAKAAGFLSARYGLGFADAIIAASADMEGATLVTRNVRHFSKVGHIINIEKPY